MKLRIINSAELPSCFAVSELAVATIKAAAIEMAYLKGSREIKIDRRLASLWFQLTLKPVGWRLPFPWDSITGLYKASDGWIRLHTYSPSHRAATLRVLDCEGTKKDVAHAVAQRKKFALEQEIVSQSGAAAALRSREDWTSHSQGLAISREPLIWWETLSEGAPAVDFDELKVLDLTRVLAGPVATRFLAGFGAQVLRIDPPWWREPGVEPEVTVGKLRTGLNLQNAEDREVFEQLLPQADVLVHSFRPGALDNLGYTRKRLSALAPHMINASLCAYGWSGPWADRRGYDSLVQMSCGIAQMGMLVTPADAPVSLPVQALDHATGYLTAAAVLCAVRQRNETGTITAARLSLARTAELLISGGLHRCHGDAIKRTSGDIEPSLEMTDWGPARRLRFPVQLDGQGVVWKIPAGHLRVHQPHW